jgi:hypothetical protein
LEFGSRTHYSHSWATLGNRRFGTFDLSVTMRFSNRLAGAGFIGVGFRSQHFFANFTHMVYLNHNGEILLVQPDDGEDLHYRDIRLRSPTPIDYDADHSFHVVFDEHTLKVRVDEFSTELAVADMPKVLGPGVLRLQSHSTWIALSNILLRIPKWSPMRTRAKPFASRGRGPKRPRRSASEKRGTQ